MSGVETKLVMSLEDIIKQKKETQGGRGRGQPGPVRSRSTPGHAGPPRDTPGMDQEDNQLMDLVFVLEWGKPLQGSCESDLAC